MIGVIMGSFDPVHKGHEHIVNLMIEQRCANMINIENVNGENKLFSKIIILPAFKNVAKEHAASYTERLMMLNIAFKEQIASGKVEISTLEMDIAVNPPKKIYTANGIRSVDSMSYFVNQYKDEEVVFITTSETMCEMRSWWDHESLRKFKYFLIRFDNIYDEEYFKERTYDVYNIIGEIKIETPKIHSSNIRKGSRSLRESYMNPDVLKFMQLYKLYETKKNWSYRVPDGEHAGRELWSGRNMAGCGIVLKKDAEGKLFLLANERGRGCPDYVGYWNMTCGYIEGNETALEGVIREMREECGLVLKGKINDQIKHFKLIHVEDEPGFCNGSNVTMRFFAIITDDDIEKEISLRRHYGGETNEVEDVRWIPIEEYERYKWAFNHRSVIDDLMKRLKTKAPEDAYDSILFETKKK